jgi:murein DD-endopeptidase MepM/ murein hydrolase activator NlpD
VLVVACVTTFRLEGGTARAADDQLEHLDQQLADVQARRAQLEAAIAEAERAIPALRSRVEDLEVAVKERAVQLYIGHRDRLEMVFDAASVVTGARAAQLTGVIAEHATALAGSLHDAVSKLELRETELSHERDALQRTIDALVPLRAQLQERLRKASAGYCPVDGSVVFSDNFHEVRPGGAIHQGIDMNAVSGTPVVAPVGGVVRHDVGGAGGNGAWLAGTDDVSYYFAHFSRYEGDERVVTAGEVIGYVGATGDATGPHLHFEMHPGGGTAIDPYPLLVTSCADETAHDVG